MNIEIVIEAKTKSKRRSIFLTTPLEVKLIASVNKNGTSCQEVAHNTPRDITRDKTTAEICPYKIVISITNSAEGIIIQIEYGVEKIGNLEPNAAQAKTIKKKII